MTKDATRQVGHPARVSVVIPAHDEAAVIEANLHALLDGTEPGRLEVVVVCNGCTDETADIARRFDGVRVVEITEPSKARAVQVGNTCATAFPRVHLDADVTISGADVLRLAAALGDEVHAVAPVRVLPLARSSWPVRSYYRVWERLPQVRRGLFGRGAIALSAAGQRRVDALPTLMSDDLAISEAFGEAERRVVPDATVVVHPPRTTADLLHRRVRVVTGNAQASDLGIRRRESVTTPTVLLAMAARHPRLALHLPLFLGIGLLARARSRRAVRTRDFTTWLRDESSRA
ncbi:glycosyltransferase [Nocardioides sp. 503]|uniref:glycosyltransferase n=1 Tax=Nocardioides sp. 503 TaxID=2508326 RepID=UPI001ADA03DF|nr:glycosyltransferase [Nocardioides sp. 503]